MISLIICFLSYKEFLLDLWPKLFRLGITEASFVLLSLTRSFWGLGDFTARDHIRILPTGGICRCAL